LVLCHLSGTVGGGTLVAHWEQLLEEVVRTRRMALIAYACLFTRDRVEAEELVQEAVVRTFSRTRTWPDARSAEAYVRSAIRTSFLDATRRRKTWRDTSHLFTGDRERRSPDDTATTGLDVRAALGALPPRERACVILRYIDDLTVADVAAELGLSDGAVKRYLFDGVRTLRSELGDAVSWPDDHVGPTVTITPRPTRSAS
jgi:RNA polymerase sigma-70 factor (ECF subfamily)